MLSRKVAVLNHNDGEQEDRNTKPEPGIRAREENFASRTNSIKRSPTVDRSLQKTVKSHALDLTAKSGWNPIQAWSP